MNVPTDVPLTDLLADLGYSHRKSPPRLCQSQYAHDVYQGDDLVFTGDAGQVLDWLHGLPDPRAAEDAASALTDDDVAWIGGAR